jgi:hypothetical protein
MTRVRGLWEATPAWQAMSLTLARIRLLVADAYRLGQRQRTDPNREAAKQLGPGCDGGSRAGPPEHRRCGAAGRSAGGIVRFCGVIRGTRLGASPHESAEYLDGWDAAIACVAARLFGEGSPEVKALETLPPSRTSRQVSSEGGRLLREGEGPLRYARRSRPQT